MRALLALVMVVVATAACNGSGSDVACGDRGTLTGVILDVESRSLTDVQAFTIRSQDEECEVFIDPDIDYGFPLPHLNDHKVAADPVIVDVEVRDDKLTALTIRDTQS